MAVDLSVIKFAAAKPRYRDFGGVLTPPLGGAEQQINRLGNRYGLLLELPPMREEPDGRIATALLQAAKAEGASYPWPQPGLDIGTPGSPVVDGAVAGGTSVPMRSLAPGYRIRFGQYFNLIHAGIPYLHHAAEAAVADGSGEVMVTIRPELRISLSDGGSIEIARPVLQGLLEPGDLTWEIMTAPYTALDSFLISEPE